MLRKYRCFWSARPAHARHPLQPQDLIVREKCFTAQLYFRSHLHMWLLPISLCYLRVSTLAHSVQGRGMNAKLQIILADDSMFFRTIESKFLQKELVEIVEATNCAEVHDLIRKQQPGLIYMSFTLPEEGGDKCCREIKKNPATGAIPIVMVCDQDAANQPEEAKSSGCDACLVKPLDRYSFLQAGRKFLDGIREHRQPSFFSLTFASGGKDYVGKCLDISGGGMFIETQADVPVGTLINMQFKLPDGPVTAIICSGEVTWQNRKPNPRKSHYPNGLGVKFVGLPEHVNKSILRFSEKQSF